MLSNRTDLVEVRAVLIDRVTAFGVFSRIGTRIVFIPRLLIETPPPSFEPGATVTLSIPRWFARENQLIMENR